MSRRFASGNIYLSARADYWQYGGDVSKMVPPVVQEALRKKFAK